MGLDRSGQRSIEENGAMVVCVWLTYPVRENVPELFYKNFQGCGSPLYTHRAIWPANRGVPPWPARSSLGGH